MSKGLRATIVAGVVTTCLIVAAAIVWVGPPVSPGLEVGESTTYFPAPLTTGGVPDYGGWWSSRAQQGITLGNNAAAPLVYLPLEREREELWRRRFAGFLGVNVLRVNAVQYETLRSLIARVAASLPLSSQILRADPKSLSKEQLETLGQVGLTPTPELLCRLADTDAERVDLLENAVWEAWEIARRAPWNRGDYPLLAEWVDKNQQGLDLMVAGAKRDQFYVPLIREDGRNPILLLRADQVAPWRYLGCLLVIRAMMKAGEGRCRDAWEDLLAVLRFGRLQSLGFGWPVTCARAMENTGPEAIQAILRACEGDQSVLGLMARDLAELPLERLPNELTCFDVRLVALDTVVQLNSGALSIGELGRIEPVWQNIPTPPWDANEALRQVNRHFDFIERTYRDFPVWEIRDARIVESYLDGLSRSLYASIGSERTFRKGPSTRSREAGRLAGD